MAQQVVVICSAGEEAVGRGLCSAIEARGLRCWSPVLQAKAVSAATTATQVSAAGALVVLTWDAAEQNKEIAIAKDKSIPTVIAVPAFNDGGTWVSTLKELAQVLNLPEPSPPAEVAPAPSGSKIVTPDDEAQHIEFIAENVSEAQVFERFGLFDKALSRLRAVLQRAPRNLEAHDELLKILVEEELFDDAAAIAADYLAALRYRGEESSFEILRTHLISSGFDVDEGPPISVGAAGSAPKTTRFTAGNVASAPGSAVMHPAERPAPRAPAKAPAAPKSKPATIEFTPLEIPILRNFRAGNAVLDGSGVDADLSGIDFLLDHGLLDEARARIAYLIAEHPDHPGVLDRMKKIEAIAGTATPIGLTLALDEDWASAPSHEQQVDTFFATPTPEAPTEPAAKAGPEKPPKPQRAHTRPAAEPAPVKPAEVPAPAKPAVAPVPTKPAAAPVPAKPAAAPVPTKPAAAPVPARPAAAPAQEPKRAFQPVAPVPRPVGRAAATGASLVCSVFAPSSVEPGDMFVVRACIHLPSQTETGGVSIIDERSEAGMLSMLAEQGAEVGFTLQLPGFEIDGADAERSWGGVPESVEFGVVVPYSQTGGDIAGWLSVSVDGMPAAEVPVRIVVV